MCHALGSFFEEKFRKGYVNFSQKFWKEKKFLIWSVILRTQMTNQKKTELIDYFDLV